LTLNMASRRSQSAKRPRPTDPGSENPSDTPKIVKMGDQNENNLSHSKNLVNANNKEVAKVTNQPSSSTHKKLEDSRPVVKSPKGNVSPRSARPYTKMFKWTKQHQASTPGLNMGADSSLTTDNIQRSRKFRAGNGKVEKAQCKDWKENAESGRANWNATLRSAYPTPDKTQQSSNDAKPLAIRLVDPEKEKPVDTSKISKISSQNGDKLPNESPKPSTSSSKDETETENQELHEQIDLHDKEQSEDDQEVENSRTNLRIQYIALIEKTNGKLFDKEEALTSNDIKRDGLKKKLKEKQDMEKEDMDIKFHKELKDLDHDMDEYDKQMQELEKKWFIAKKRLDDKKEEKKKETEEILKRHRDENTALDKKLRKEQDNDKTAVDKLKEKTKKIGKDLQNLLPDPTHENCSKDKDSLEAARATLECPICMEMMKPPTKIWMCSSNHIVCEPCRGKLKGKRCPTCRTEAVTLRAHLAENFARTVFDDVKIQVTVTPDISLLFDSDDEALFIAADAVAGLTFSSSPQISKRNQKERKALVEKKKNVGNKAAGGSKTKRFVMFDKLPLPDIMDSDSD